MRPGLRISTVALVAVLFATAGCGPGKKGDAYREELTRTIAQAQEIQVTEHSSPYDAGVSQQHEYLYISKILTGQEKARLLDAVSHMDPKPQDALLACMPRYHHTFRFTDSKGGNSVIQICFQCSQVDWPGHTQDNPWAIYDTLGGFLESASFHRTRDWDALAKEAISKAGP